MSSIYLDTSAFLAVLFGEPKSGEIMPILRSAEGILSSALLEAEARAAGARRNRPAAEMDMALGRLALFQPERLLTPEIKAVVAAAPSLRGADLWHLACALYLAGDPANLPFVTLDGGQAGAAERLGFKVLPAVSPRSSGAREPQAVYGAKKSRGKVHA